MVYSNLKMRPSRMTDLKKSSTLPLNSPKNCKNCGHALGEHDHFCPNCGQGTSVDKIQFKSLIQEFTESIFQFNHGFFFTLVSLFSHPGASLSEYLQGKRRTYYRPLAYALVLSTIYFLITRVIGQPTWMDDFVAGWLSETGDAVDKSPVLLIWFSKNYAYASLLVLPVFSLASFLSFRKQGRNYTEHIVINSYITGQQAIFYSISSVISLFIEESWIETLPILVSMIYCYWVFQKLFTNSHSFFNLLRVILTYFLYLIFATILLGIGMALAEI